MSQQKFAAYFQNTFPYEHLWKDASVSLNLVHNSYEC